MADEKHDDADEPVIPGPEDEVAAADAPVSVAPFIDDDDDTAAEEASDDAVSEDASAGDQSAKGSKSAVGAAVATSKAKGASTKKTSKAKTGSKDDDVADEDDKPKVTRRVVTSKRVTPKGGGQKSSVPKKTKGQPVDDDEGFRSTRYTPPGGQGAYSQGPSPWWVPALLFGFLIIGALIIMLNYMGVFGDAQNLRLVIGLGFILAGILTSTQYR